MRRFFLISNVNRDPEYRVRDHACEYLTERGADCVCRKGPEDKLPSETECVVVFGGDGTLLRVVRQYADSPVAFIGINTGYIGYLTEGNIDKTDEILDSLLKDEYLMEKRMMLQGQLFRDGKPFGRARALNDIVIGRTHSMKIIRMNVYVNGQFLCQYRADGVIISTPTGSTAYNFSAGGPIVEPTARLFVMTPISSHSLNNRSLVLAPQDHIAVEIVHDMHYAVNATEFEVFFDGEDPIPLQSGDRIEVTQASAYIRILKRSERSFVETLRIKMSD